MNLAEIENLVEKQISEISQLDLIETIRKYRVPLRIENREWDYSDSYEEFPCCIIIEDKKSNTAVTFCEEGFGPTYPWGLLDLEDENMSMGMDSDWFISLEDAIRNSMFWQGENPSNYEVK